MKKQATLQWMKPYHNTVWYCLMVFVFLSGTLSAQGWQQSIGGDDPEEGWAVVEDIDGGFLILGAGVDPDGDFDQDVFLVKLDIDGVFVWSKFIDNGGQQLPRAIARTADGNYIIVGSIDGDSSDNDVQLLKIDPRGNQIWSRSYGGDVSESANDVVALADGGFVIVGENDAGSDVESDILVVRYDALGNARWQKTIGTDRSDIGNAIISFNDGFALVGNSKNETGFDSDIVIYRLDSAGETIWDDPIRLSNNFLEEGRDIIATKDGGIAIAGIINDQPDAFIAKFDADGNQKWTRTLGSSENEEIANALTELEDGSIVIAGIIVQSSGINVDMYLAKVDALGNPIWDRTLGRTDFLDEARSIVPTLDGGFALAGYNSPGLTFKNDVVLVKTDALGNTLTNLISGSVYHDLDQGCDLDEGEQGLKNWIVLAKGENETFYGTTDENGNYNIPVDTGLYIVDFIPENTYWARCQEDGYPVTFNSFYDTLAVDMAAISNVDCPYLEIDISTPYLVRCENVVYTVEYCNLGTTSASDARVEVLLDNQLSFQESAMAVTQEEQKLIFSLGEIAAGDCGTFQFTAQSACTGIAKNQAVLVEANIFPDTSCITPSPDWDQSDIRVSGTCNEEGDVIFQISNIGIKDMLKPQRTVVIEGELILNIGDYRLASMEETSIRIPSSGRETGSTLRLIADQSEDHPFKTFATAAVEGCGTDLGTDFETGTLTQFPEDDAEPNRSKDVQEVIDSVPGIRLVTQPKGYKGGIISADTDLNYKFLFTNTSEETVDRVVIRDTLSNNLDLATLQMGASSHPYTFEVYNNGILKITFDDINLLPKEAEGPAEIAFVEFKIGQKENNLAGTIIANRASIFYDYQTPIISNLVENVVDEFPGFVSVVVDIDNEFDPGIKLNVYPNPFKESVRFILNSNSTFSQLKFRVFDSTGREVDQRLYRGNQFDYHRNSNLKAGLYFFQLESEGQLISSGKLLVQ